MRVCQLAEFATHERSVWRRITSTSNSKPSRVATPDAPFDSAAWLHRSRQRWQRNTRDAQVCAQGSRVSNRKTVGVLSTARRKRNQVARGIRRALSGGLSASGVPDDGGVAAAGDVRTCLATPCACDATSNQTGAWYRDVSHFDLISAPRPWPRPSTPARCRIGSTSRRRCPMSPGRTTSRPVPVVMGQDRNDAQSNGDISTQQYRNGVPESVVVTINPFGTEEYVKADMGIYMQDTWKINA